VANLHMTRLHVLLPDRDRNIEDGNLFESSRFLSTIQYFTEVLQWLRKTVHSTVLSQLGICTDEFMMCSTVETTFVPDERARATFRLSLFGPFQIYVRKGVKVKAYYSVVVVISSNSTYCTIHYCTVLRSIKNQEDRGFIHDHVTVLYCSLRGQYCTYKQGVSWMHDQNNEKRDCLMPHITIACLKIRRTF